MIRKTSLKLLGPIAILVVSAALMAFRPLPIPSNADDWCLAGYPAGSLTCCSCPVKGGCDRVAHNGVAACDARTCLDEWICEIIWH